MFWFRAFLTLSLVLSPVIFIAGCGLFVDKAPETASENSELPKWVQLSHRQEGILGYEYEPLDFEDTDIASGGAEEVEEQDFPAGSAGPGPRPNPTGSPYEPGTIDDMIWQQKQKDLVIWQRR